MVCPAKGQTCHRTVWHTNWVPTGCIGMGRRGVRTVPLG